MVKQRDYKYADAATQRTGIMRCAACGRDIVSGQYRYHETTKAFVNYHRACTSEDQMWTKLDAQVSRDARRRGEFLAELRGLAQRYAEYDILDFAEMVSEAQ